MIRKGYHFQISHFLTFRHQEEGDKYKNGKEIAKHHLVFVRLKYCPVIRVREDGLKIVEPKGVQGIPLDSHWRNMGIGPERREGPFLERTLYLVEDGRVYSACDRVFHHAKGARGHA